MATHTESRLALLQVKRGWDPALVAEELVSPLQEQMTPTGAAGLIGAAALGAHGLFRGWQAASSVSDKSLLARMIQLAIGGAASIGNAYVSKSISDATLAIHGGGTGQGNESRFYATINQPPTTKKVVRGGSGVGGFGGRQTTIEMPVGGETQIAQIQQRETPDGFAVDMYRVDPLQGTVQGAPVKTFNMILKGRQPPDVKQLQANISRTLAQIANAAIGNRNIRIPSQVVYRPVYQGRPKKLGR